ncbi:MAG: aspartate aminotransferase family protein [Mesorhizobium sp.]|nr:aspartate aminotransferase family protein [Mesorhizobium sp.]
MGEAGHAFIRDEPDIPRAHGGPIQLFYSADPTANRPVISHASGIHMWDTDGRRYIDGSSGPVVTNIGYGNRHVLDAMMRQAEKVCYASRAIFENQPNIDLADLVTGLAGPGLDRAFLTSGGSEATEAAIKLARQYAVTRGEPHRWKVLGRNPGYHGATLGAAAVTGDPDSEALFGPGMRVMPKVPAPFTYRLPDNHDADSHARYCATALDEAIRAEGPETVLAFIMEPVGGLATGALVAPDHYYLAVREICDRHGVLLIYDEVMSGAGRTGTFLAADHWPDARPDMVTLAKGIAAGYTPLGMMLASAEMVDTVARSGGFMHGHTYTANPLSCAVGLAVVEEMLAHDLMANARDMGALLRQRLRALMGSSSVIGDVRGLGLLNAVEIVSDRETKAIFPSETHAVERIIALALERGLMLYTRRTAGGQYGEWLMLTPPLIVTAQDINEIVTIFGEAIAAFEREIGRT